MLEIPKAMAESLGLSSRVGVGTGSLHAEWQFYEDNICVQVESGNQTDAVCPRVGLFIPSLSESCWLHYNPLTMQIENAHLMIRGLL